jgi:hypothetical protein
MIKSITNEGGTQWIHHQRVKTVATAASVALALTAATVSRRLRQNDSCHHKGRFVICGKHVRI